MHELELDATDSAELLELVEGEASCALAYDAVARLYDELIGRPPSAACLWRLSDDERQELLPELEECAETIERAVLDRLVACLQVSPSSADPGGPGEERCRRLCTFETSKIDSSATHLDLLQ